MGLISKLLYDTKTNPVAIVDRTQQATAEDFNEIKTVVNNCADGINWIKSGSVNLPSGTTTVLFATEYAVGVPFSLIISDCLNEDGYLTGHTITNADRFGFDVTVAEAVTLVYLAVPTR